MAAPPAFQFYWADYLIGTKTMTAAERGVYVDCLCHQWDTGSLPGDDLRDLALVMRVSEREARQYWARISGKFTRGAEGLWRNGRLEAERRKQADYRAKKVSSGKAGGLAKAKQTPSEQPSEHVAKFYPPSSSPVQQEQQERTAPEARRSSVWRRAVAIAHKSVEAYPSSLPDQADWFKTTCAQQGIDYGLLGGKDSRPLYARALDYVHGVKAQRPRAVAS